MALTLVTTNSGFTDQASVSFTEGLDSTYKLFIFKFFDINPATDLAEFTFNGSVDAGSNYNVTKTTTFFRAYHEEDDDAALGYTLANDLGQSTAAQNLSVDVGNGADESCAGTLWLFNPSSTTYVKHFYCTNSTYDGRTGIGGGAAANNMIGGYFNNTDNIDAVQFKMSAGNFDGTIAMYGVDTS